MINYKTLGLVNTREMFKKAVKGGYAIPAFNFNNMEQLQAIVQASVETKSPVILQVSKGARDYANQTLLRYMAEGAVAYAKELGCEKPEIVLHLDHGDSFETCKSCIDMGFSSVMIDGSHLPYEENVALTKKVVEYAHQFDVTVEGELGVLAGVEDEVSAEESHYTKPEEVVDFVTKTGCDSLAISIGTSHGAYKFTPEQCTLDPETGRLLPPRALLNCELWDRDMITEDIGVTWKLEKKFWDIRYEPRALCMMLVPETVKGLYKQRKRWSQGGMEILRRHGNIFKDWKTRRMAPVYIEQICSIVWALCWLLHVSAVHLV